MSLRDLARLVGASPETIRKYEGGSVPDADRLAKVAFALGVTELELGGIKVSVAGPRPTRQEAKGEQLRLDFNKDYVRSRVGVKIRPSSISLTVSVLRANVRSR